MFGWEHVTAAAAAVFLLVPLSLQHALGWPQQGGALQRFYDAANPIRLAKQWQAIFGQLGKCTCPSHIHTRAHAHRLL